jgi:hypothetical protein
MREVEPVAVPRFNCDWTTQMGEWLRDQVANLPSALSLGELDAAYQYTAEDFLSEHWEAICDSWGCKDKYHRIIDCLDSLEQVRKNLPFFYHLNKRAECWAKGHVLVDRSSAGPDSGDADCECARCGQSWHIPLY